LLNPKSGFQQRAAISLEGLQQVLALRRKWGVPKRVLGSDVSRYYDARFYDAALK